MRLKTEIADVIETVEPVHNGSNAGQRLAVFLMTPEACRFADLLIRKGRWRIRKAAEHEWDHKREDRE